MPEYFATSLWSANENANNDFGYNIVYSKLGLSQSLIKRLEAFDGKVFDIIDWNDPNSESPMSFEDRKNLYYEGRELMAEVAAELGDNFEIVDALNWITPDK